MKTHQAFDLAGVGVLGRAIYFGPFGDDQFVEALELSLLTTEQAGGTGPDVNLSVAGVTGNIDPISGDLVLAGSITQAGASVAGPYYDGIARLDVGVALFQQSAPYADNGEFVAGGNHLIFPSLDATLQPLGSTDPPYLTFSARVQRVVIPVFASFKYRKFLGVWVRSGSGGFPGIWGSVMCRGKFGFGDNA